MTEEIVEADIVFEEIKFSLGELQCVLIDETEPEYINWLEKRIQHLRDHPDQQDPLGDLEIIEMKTKTKRVDGIKRIKKRIDKLKV